MTVDPDEVAVADADATGAAGRVVVYALTSPRVDGAVRYALEALRPHARRLVLVAPRGTPEEAVSTVRDLLDAVLVSEHDRFRPAVYPWACKAIPDLTVVDEIVFTGDGAFGPIGDIAAVLSRVAAEPRVDLWTMTENAQGRPESFPLAGFPARVDPWTWTAVRPSVLRTESWLAFWADPPGPEDALQDALPRWMAARQHSVSCAFPAADFPSAHPALFTPTLLLRAGCPWIERAVFALYPPYLDRFAVIGRPIIAEIDALGYPVPLLLSSLAQTVPPKTLYANAGLLEILASNAVTEPAASRIAAVVHATDIAGVDEVLRRLEYLPGDYDLYLTTTDGKRATELARLVESRGDSRVRAADVRVTPASEGRDMSDFFVGCRDVLLGGEYDLVVKLHARPSPRKTMNVQRYFRRYQYENLLDSPGYVANLLTLFDREPGLGAVFPPMMHIGYSTMGRGWAGLRSTAEKLCAQLGISVPLDEVSPLAPFGGMWIARPGALAPLARERWRYGDYGIRGALRYRNLARLQERMVAYSAAAAGFHCRTVLTQEHAEIAHTALESKSDELFATTRGWPVEQIGMLHRAGHPGHGGVVALARMYIRVNHPRAARIVMPVFDAALRLVLAARSMRADARRVVSMIRGR